MAKKIIFILIFFYLLIFLNNYLKISNKSPNYLVPSENIYTNQVKEKSHEIYSLIKNINYRNEKINSIYIPYISIKIKQKISINTTGSIYFKKENQYRMIVKSIIGQEMDIGSNKNHFWFWSRNMNPPYLFYAKHEDLDKAMLKTPLNPSWMIESLTLNEIDSKNIEIGEIKGNWIILQKRKAARNEDVTVAILISKEKNPKILGNYLYNNQGKMIASTEISNYYNINELLIPKTMFINWYEEGLSMQWNLGEPQINVKIPDMIWQIPNHIKKIEIK